MMKKKCLLMVLLCAVLALGMLGFTACSQDQVTEEPNGYGNGSGGDSAETTEQTYQVSLYFANEEWVAGGDVEKFIIHETEMTSNTEDVYMDALELLKAPPDEDSDTVITDQTKLNDVYLEGDTVYVDLNGTGLNGGSMTEGIFISQIVNTLIDSFDEVKQVQFLVDGEIVESLMGHVGTEEPFTKDVFTE